MVNGRSGAGARSLQSWQYPIVRRLPLLRLDGGSITAAGSVPSKGWGEVAAGLVVFGAVALITAVNVWFFWGGPADFWRRVRNSYTFFDVWKYKGTVIVAAFFSLLALFEVGLGIVHLL